MFIKTDKFDIFGCGDTEEEAEQDLRQNINYYLNYYKNKKDSEFLPCGLKFKKEFLQEYCDKDAL